jgi:Lrp/AsnC family transcriptional regulator, leucine-responsive regulatory protein
VLRRLRRLRREGVIAADVSIVHPSVLGLPLTVHVLVSLEREGLAELDAFTRKLRARPEVRQAWYVTGEADFVLHLQLAGMGAYEGFARDVFHDDRNVRAFRTIISMRQVIGEPDAKPRPMGEGQPARAGGRAARRPGERVRLPAARGPTLGPALSNAPNRTTARRTAGRSGRRRAGASRARMSSRRS